MQGRVITGEDGRSFELGPMVAYQGKEDCRNPTCFRGWYGDTMADEGCAGYHCAVCHKPSSMYGHKACQEADVDHRQPGGASTSGGGR